MSFQKKGLARLREVKIDLLNIPVLGRFLISRWFQPLLHFLNMFIFGLVILTGIFGTPVGSANFSIIITWILWFALLLMVLVPLLGRGWCIMCPIPAPAEWLSRLSVIRMWKDRWSLGIKWPKKLDNIWLQNLLFAGVALFSPIILTRPMVTGYLLLGFILLAVVLDLTFTSRGNLGKERSGRIFCRYLCPVSGFIGLYSMVSPFGMRVRDFALCEKHKRKNPHLKECIAGCGPGTGNPSRASRNQGYGCPWFVYPGELRRNAYCGLCTECLKTCPLDNTTYLLQPFKGLTDLFHPDKRKLEEAFKGFIMLAAAAIYSAVMLGWWPGLKDVGNFMGGSPPSTFHPGQFGIYAGFLLGIIFFLVPLLNLVFTFLANSFGGKTNNSLKKLFVDYAFSLVPMGLFSWIAFSLSFLLINGSYIVNVLDDPFGWGWSLFGLAGFHWTPFLSRWIPILQAIILIGGLGVSLHTCYRIARQNYSHHSGALRATWVYGIFLWMITGTFLWLYLG